MEVSGLDAYYQTFAQGVVVYASDFGAVRISQAILAKWLSLAGQLAEDGSDLRVFVGPLVSDLETYASHEQGV